MSKDEMPLRSPPVKTDAELLAEMGTNPKAWAREMHKIMPFGFSVSIATAWFHHAIEAGRQAERAATSQKQ